MGSSHSYIAVRCFRGMNDSFVPWLLKENLPKSWKPYTSSNFVQDKESWGGMECLDGSLVRRLGLKVPKPKWMINGKKGYSSRRIYQLG